MKRLSLIGSWKRIGVQAGLLAGIGLAFVGGSQSPELEAAPPPGCKPEGMCTFKKPLFMIILDYSTSMNADFMGNGSRWENAVSAVKLAVDSDNGFIVSNFVLGLMRFGHDPSPNAGTTIPNDTSGIVDGQKIDVEFYDANDPNNKYYECGQGDAIKAALDGVPSPINGNLVGIGTWTRGALEKARAYFDQTLADHPADANPMSPRLRSILLLTDGEWTSQDGTQKLMPAGANPNPIAMDMYDNDKIPTYVVAIGEAMGKMFADTLAAAGGTGQAYDAANPQALVDALKLVIQDLIAQQIKPICTPGLPRIMVLLDASSSMLNLQAGLVRAKMGQGGWEQARDALAGPTSIFDVMVQNGEVQDLVHLGLSVFGGNMPDESDVLVQYGPCHKDNFGWALDPQNSCQGPGCVDPYADAPITWTFQDGQNVPPNFDEPTLSHMPLCNQGTAPNKGCFGSGTFTHLGLVTVQNNITAYKAECSMPNADQPCDNGTQFINILITDGQTNSMANQYNPPLMQMNANGVKTYVIGFGDGVDSPQAIASMNDMAMNGGTGMYYDAQNQAALEAALADIIEGVNFDPCCGFNSCDLIPEPTSMEPDPLPENTSSGGDGTTTTGVDPDTGDLSTTTTGVGPTSATDTDPGTESSAGPTTQEPDPDTTAAPTSTTGVDPDTGNVPTSGGVNTTPPAEPDPVPAETDSEEGGGDSSGSTTAGADDEGCGCATDSNPAKGLLGTFLTFGLAGFLRRRRR